MPADAVIPVMTSPPGPVTVIDGRRYFYFGGTSYLGLAGHPSVIAAGCEALQRYGVHTATSRRGFGHNPPTLEVERRAAGFFGQENAFYFASGYTANHILLQALAARVGAVFVDAGAHYCLHEAARLLGRPAAVFRHRDPDDLARALREARRGDGCPLVLTDGVFSVSGRLAPLPDLLRVLADHAPAWLHVDDAHGWGVLGEQGRGALEHFGLWGAQVNSSTTPDGVALTVCGTLAKALGGFGGLIPGTCDFVRKVREASHYFDGASAPSAADAGATAQALEIVQQQPALRRQLRANSGRLRAGLRALGLAVADDPSAHFSVEIGDGANMRRLHERLKSLGFLVPYVARYAGLGPAGALRFAVCALHTPEMIDDLLQAVGKVL